MTWKYSIVFHSTTALPWSLAAGVALARPWPMRWPKPGPMWPWPISIWQRPSAAPRHWPRLGVRSLAIQVDVTQADQVRRMVAMVIDAWGHLDVAVNSVGIANRSLPKI